MYVFLHFEIKKNVTCKQQRTIKTCQQWMRFGRYTNSSQGVCEMHSAVALRKTRLTG